MSETKPSLTFHADRTHPLGGMLTQDVAITEWGIWRAEVEDRREITDTVLDELIERISALERKAHSHAPELENEGKCPDWRVPLALTSLTKRVETLEAPVELTRRFKAAEKEWEAQRVSRETDVLVQRGDALVRARMKA
jgi:hypothetical protein